LFLLYEYITMHDPLNIKEPACLSCVICLHFYWIVLTENATEKLRSEVHCITEEVPSCHQHPSASIHVHAILGKS